MSTEAFVGGLSIAQPSVFRCRNDRDIMFETDLTGIAAALFSRTGIDTMPFAGVETNPVADGAASYE